MISMIYLSKSFFSGREKEQVFHEYQLVLDEDVFDVSCK